MKHPTTRLIDLKEIDKTMLASVGGKAAHLGELSRLQGVKVPGGCCITTEVYKAITARSKDFASLLDQLATLHAANRKAIAATSAAIRNEIEACIIPGEMVNEISRQLALLGEKNAFAVRSSATAEDLPGASFAGQQDTYLNIRGLSSILQHISKCWASLFTERAVTYRIQNEFDHRKVFMAVIIQQMIFPEAAGILFTADPLNGNRQVVSIDASFGLGEALVAGLVNADNYKVCKGRIIERKIASKQLAVYALQEGGTKEQALTTAQQNLPALQDEQVLQLANTGKKIEAYFGSPQDIEWCCTNDSSLPGGQALYIVQSRPITTLYPIPHWFGADNNENRVYVSVGHNQMMTDAMKPLGLSFFLLTTPAPMQTAGGRLFVDITAMLAAPASRATIIDTLGKSDPLIKDALMNITARSAFFTPAAAGTKDQHPGERRSPFSIEGFRNKVENDPAIVADLIKSSELSITTLQHNIEGKSGTALLDFILEDIQQLKNKILFDPKSLHVIMAAMDASAWINEKMMEWLGEKNAADTISQSVYNNITSEMGLALLDVADTIRPYPQLVDYLQGADNADFLNGLLQLEGGTQACDAINTFLSKYGMRCAGEIDITKTRWSENPAALLPVLLSNIKNLAPHAASQQFEQGRRAALNKEQDLLKRLAALPGGEEKAAETKQMIDLVRNFIGYREYPKYGKVCSYFIYKKALLKEAGRLVAACIIHESEDIYWLSFEELRHTVDTHTLDYALINKRKEEYKLFEKLTPPRVITSADEIIAGAYKHEKLPAGAMAGLAVSSGITEGRARVILHMEDAALEAGDILVTTFTDPSWTPLFVGIKGLVTEVGGLMTHGAVIAREYGLPAVVGVEHATQLIKDGQRIRVNGTDGYVELL